MGVLESRLENGEVIILDGAMATELQRRGVDLHTEAWSVRSLLSSPDVVRAIHEDYIKAGAEIITANSFSAGPTTLEKAGLRDHTAKLNNIAVRLAQEARDNVGADKQVLIAGSMTTAEPWHDPHITPSIGVARSHYREQSELLANAGVDLFLIEFMVRIFDIEVAIEEAVKTGVPTWVGLACQFNRGELFLGLYGRLGNETIPQVVETVASKGASGMFIMHTFPEHTALGLGELMENWSLPVGAYANTGDLDRKTPVASKATSGGKGVEYPYTQWDFSGAVSPDEYLKYAQEWVNMGAQIIGGCCGTSPEHIKKLKEHLPERIPK